MANIRHVVVIRSDLNLSVGLMSAQVAHINDAWLRENYVDGKEPTMDQKDWCNKPYLSVLSVDNCEELLILIEEAKDAGLEVKQWRDLIPSKNLKRNLSNVLIGCSIGPADNDRIKAITGGLPLA